MFDFEQLMKGYSQEDEFIARDILILELLLEKNIISEKEIDEVFKKLPNKIQEVKKTREDFVKEEYGKVLKNKNEEN